MRRALRVLLILPWLAASGCTTYHRMELNPAVVAARLAPPDMAALRIQAQEIKHPVLKPVKIKEEEGLGPDDAAILAVLVNPKLRAERDKRGVSAAQLYQAGILPNPEFSGSLDIPVGGSTAGTVDAYGLGLSYDLYSLITRGANIDAARAHDSSVVLDVAWQEWQVAEAAKLHAYRLFLLEKQLAVAKEEEQGLQQNLAAVNQAVQLGDMTIIALSAVRASVERVHLSMLGIEQTRDQERLALNRSMGFPPAHAIRLRKEIDLPSLEEVEAGDELSAGIEGRRLDLLALRIGYESQEARVRGAVLGQFPRITTGFSQARDTGNVVTRGVSLTLSLPVFDRNQGRIAVESATREQLFDEYAARLFEAQSNIAKFRSDMESISRQVKATEAYLPTQKQLVETYYNALLQGNADVLTYYNARDELIATRISLLSLALQSIERFIALELEWGGYLWQGEK